MDKKKWMTLFVLICLLLVPSYVKSIQKGKALSGITIVLDSGHGGKDMGASYGGVEEAPLNLIITKKLAQSLQALGGQVVLTRSDDKDLATDTAVNRKKEDMKKRVEIINDEKNDLFISIHMNKYQSEEVKGLHVFYKNTSESSKVLAETIQASANRFLNQDKEIKKGDFYLLNNARIQGVLIECGFISNEQDRSNLLNDIYQNKIVSCICEGIVDYFEGKGMN